MNSLERRMKQLEKAAGVQQPVTLEDVVAASNGNTGAMRKVEAAEARGNDPLLMLLAESCKRDTELEIGDGD